MSEIPERTQHHHDAREFRGLPLRDPLCFLGFIAPPHGRSDVEKNVAAAPSGPPGKPLSDPPGTSIAKTAAARNSGQRARSKPPRLLPDTRSSAKASASRVSRPKH